MVWPHLASSLFLSVLQHHWLASNSSKHCTSPHLKAFILFPLHNSSLPHTYLFLSDSYRSFSSQTSPPQKGSLFSSKTYPLLHTPLYFSHSFHNKWVLHILVHHIINICQYHLIRSYFSSLDHYILGV